MEDNFFYTELFEIYGKLLTDKQRDIFEMHFNFDLSLSEIAQEKGITRQNVSDTIKNVKDKLTELESLLKLKAKKDGLLSLIPQIEDKNVVNKIQEIIGR